MLQTLFRPILQQFDMKPRKKGQTKTRDIKSEILLDSILTIRRVHKLENQASSQNERSSQKELRSQRPGRSRTRPRELISRNLYLGK